MIHYKFSNEFELEFPGDGLYLLPSPNAMSGASFVNTEILCTWWRGHDKAVQRWKGKHQQAAPMSTECIDAFSKGLSEAVLPTASY